METDTRMVPVPETKTTPSGSASAGASSKNAPKGNIAPKRDAPASACTGEACGSNPYLDAIRKRRSGSI